MIKYANQRFQIFFKFLQFIFITEFPSNHLSYVLLKFISFYNSNFNYLLLDLSQQEVIKTLINFLISENLFFKLIENHAILYEFFKKINPSSKFGEEAMHQIYQNVIMKSYSKIYTCSETLKIASTIGVELNSTYKIFLYHLINQYLANYSKVPIEFYSERAVIKIISLMISYRLFSMTELEIIKSFLRSYAHDKTIGFLQQEINFLLK